MNAFPAPLATLEGKPLGSYTLRLADVRPAAKSGWYSFRLLLASQDIRFDPAVLEGIFSAGGRGVSPWLEITEYHPCLKRSPAGAGELDLRRDGLEATLFRHLSDLIPPGGHLMLACESAEHETTYRLLMRRVPPLLTPLGHLLFDSGFRSVRFFYLAEGGWEGQQKLWAEKAADAETAARWEEAAARELLRFLAEGANAVFAGECASIALGVLRSLSPAGTLGQRISAVVEECGVQEAKDPKALFECARRVLARAGPGQS